jgi:hypothetical protein
MVLARPSKITLEILIRFKKWEDIFVLRTMTQRLIEYFLSNGVVFILQPFILTLFLP